MTPKASVEYLLPASAFPETPPNIGQYLRGPSSQKSGSGTALLLTAVIKVADDRNPALRLIGTRMKAKQIPTSVEPIPWPKSAPVISRYLSDINPTERPSERIKRILAAPQNATKPKNKAERERRNTHIKILRESGLTLAEIGRQHGITKERVRGIVSDEKPKPEKIAQRRHAAFERLDALETATIHLSVSKLAAIGETTHETARQWKRYKLFGTIRPQYKIVPIGAAAKRRASAAHSISH